MEDKGSGNGCMTFQEETYWKYFHTVHFYLILPNDFHNRLMLPKKFTDNMKGKLPETVVLKGPNEVSWNVDLVRNKDDTMFEGDGWKEFVQAYSLSQEDILVFTYNRNESFEVLLFNRKNSCEKVSSYFVRKHQRSEHNGFTGKETENNRDELSNKSHGSGHSSEHNPMNKIGGSNDTRTPRKYIETAAYNRGGFHVGDFDEAVTPIEENSESDKQNSSYYDVPSNCGKSTKKHKIARMGTPKTVLRGPCYRSNRRQVSFEEIMKAFRMAEKEKDKHHNSFLLTMKRTNVSSFFFLTIPSEWKRRNVLPKANEDVILRVKERTWLCKFSPNNSGGLRIGWREFSLENFLEESDVCLFVPGDPKFLFDVTIFRVVPEVIAPTLVK